MIQVIHKSVTNDSHNGQGNETNFFVQNDKLLRYSKGIPVIPFKYTENLTKGKEQRPYSCGQK